MIKNGLIRVWARDKVGVHPMLMLADTLLTKSLVLITSLTNWTSSEIASPVFTQSKSQPAEGFDEMSHKRSTRVEVKRSSTCVQINHFRRANRGTGSTSTCTPPKKKTKKKALARGLERKPPENVHKHTAERFCSPSTNHLANCVFEHIEVNARPNSHWKLFPLTRALKCLGSRPCQHQWAPLPSVPLHFFPPIFWLHLCFSSLCSPSCLTAAIQFWQRRFWCNSAGCECHPLIHGHFNENGERNFK